jgi:hypothetical protein
METLCFNGEETAKVKETVELYLFVKELIIFNETIDPESNTFPQVINELKNAYDHFNRVLAAKLDLKTGIDSTYTINNLDKALGHIYRACYDALDWLSINVTEDVRKELECHSNEAIKVVIPDYYSDLRPALLKYEKQITDLRAEKDVSHINSDSMNEYATIVKDLTDIRQEIIDRKSSLVEYDMKHKKENRISDAKKIIFGIVIALVVALLKVALIG